MRRRAALLLCLGGLTCAEGPPRPRYPAVAAALMRLVDPNDDKQVDLDEYHDNLLPGGSLLGGAFEELDLDGDGVLNAIELERSFLSIDPVLMRHRALSKQRGGSGAAPGEGLEPRDPKDRP